MTFDYVKFFTHKIYLFNGLFFIHSIVKVLIFTVFLKVYLRHTNIQYSVYNLFFIINTYKKTCLPLGIARHMTRM